MRHAQLTVLLLVLLLLICAVPTAQGQPVPSRPESNAALLAEFEQLARRADSLRLATSDSVRSLTQMVQDQLAQRATAGAIKAIEERTKVLEARAESEEFLRREEVLLKISLADRILVDVKADAEAVTGVLQSEAYYAAKGSLLNPVTYPAFDQRVHDLGALLKKEQTSLVEMLWKHASESSLGGWLEPLFGIVVGSPTKKGEARLLQQEILCVLDLSRRGVQQEFLRAAESDAMKRSSEGLAAQADSILLALHGAFGYNPAREYQVFEAWVRERYSAVPFDSLPIGTTNDLLVEVVFAAEQSRALGTRLGEHFTREATFLEALGGQTQICESVKSPFQDRLKEAQEELHGMSSAIGRIFQNDVYGGATRRIVIRLAATRW